MNHRKAKLYRDIPAGTRQVLILGVDTVGGEKAIDLQKQSEVCVLLLEWIYDEKLELQKVSDMIDSLKENRILEKAKSEKLVLNKVDLSNPQMEEIDLMSYLIAGLAGEAFDEQGRITLGGLCDYVNKKSKSGNKLRSSLVLPANTGEWRYKTIRLEPENINTAIAKEISDFYEFLSNGHVKFGIRKAVEIIQRLTFLANDNVLVILKKDVTNSLKSNYKGSLNLWVKSNGLQFLDRINQKRSELPAEDDIAHSELYELFESDPRVSRLEDYLSYKGFTKLMEDEHLLSLFTEICRVIMDTKEKKVLNPQDDGRNYNDPQSMKLNQFDMVIRNYVKLSVSRSKSGDAKHDKSAFSGEDET